MIFYHTLSCFLGIPSMDDHLWHVFHDGLSVPPEPCGRSSEISQHMTCFSHLRSWTRRWRCRTVEACELLDLCSSPKVRPSDPSSQVEALIIPVDLDGSSAKKQQETQEIWKSAENRAGQRNLCGALGADATGELWQLWPETRDLG